MFFNAFDDAEPSLGLAATPPSFYTLLPLLLGADRVPFLF